MPERFLHIRRQLSLAFGVEVSVGTRNGVAAGLQNLVCLGERDAGERGGRNDDGNVKRRLDLRAELLGNRGEAGNDNRLVHRHDVLMRFNPRHFGVDRGELCRVTRGERRVSAERRCDLEHRTETGGLRHLLEELRALRQIRRGLEVFHLEQFGA